MDLTEFLLARIAEDEGVARRALEVADHKGDDPTGHELVDHLGAGGDAVVAVSPMRVLEECQAKRRIIDVMADLEPGSVRGYGQHDVGPAEEVFQALALPYAGHPEFSLNWGVVIERGPTRSSFDLSRENIGDQRACSEIK